MLAFRCHRYCTSRVWHLPKTWSCEVIQCNSGSCPCDRFGLESSFCYLGSATEPWLRLSSGLTTPCCGLSFSPKVSFLRCSSSTYQSSIKGRWREGFRAAGFSGSLCTSLHRYGLPQGKSDHLEIICVLRRTTICVLNLDPRRFGCTVQRRRCHMLALRSTWHVRAHAFADTTVLKHGMRWPHDEHGTFTVTRPK